MAGIGVVWYNFLRLVQILVDLKRLPPVLSRVSYAIARGLFVLEKRPISQGATCPARDAPDSQMLSGVSLVVMFSLRLWSASLENV